MIRQEEKAYRKLPNLLLDRQMCKKKTQKEIIIKSSALDFWQSVCRSLKMKIFKPDVHD